ncbi:hypothetical protein RUM44_009364 [Polyplax serrata]|uniref:Uncharacterized protein n=1 Tax=Polyplax serrata TaxID=468196 RepID=A0ABR1ASG8_POLSC
MAVLRGPFENWRKFHPSHTAAQMGTPLPAKAERLPKIFGFVFFLVPVTSAAGKVTLANCVVLFGLVSSASCHNLMSTMRVMRATKQINSRLFAGEVAFGEIFAVALARSST